MDIKHLTLKPKSSINYRESKKKKRERRGEVSHKKYRNMTKYFKTVSTNCK
jgi:hypothetical protein